MRKPLEFLATAFAALNPLRKLRHPIIRIRAAAMNGDADAQYQLGESYLAGWCVSRQPLTGAKWLLLAADQGQVRAQHSLSLLYMTGATASGDAAAWLAESKAAAAATGNADLLYPEGLDVAPNLEKAFAFAQAAAEQGLSSAQANLGMFYLRGMGCKADFTKAREWSLRAAARKESVGGLALGVIYEHGFGVERDLYAAARWYAMSAELGNDAAATALGLFYLDGLGVERDVAKARHLLVGPASRGNEMAKSGLAEVYAAQEAETQIDPAAHGGVTAEVAHEATQGAMQDGQRPAVGF
jgi:TPR repeat protein